MPYGRKLIHGTERSWFRLLTKCYIYNLLKDSVGFPFFSRGFRKCLPPPLTASTRWESTDLPFEVDRFCEQASFLRWWIVLEEQARFLSVLSLLLYRKKEATHREYLALECEQVLLWECNRLHLRSVIHPQWDTLTCNLEFYTRNHSEMYNSK